MCATKKFCALLTFTENIVPQQGRNLEGSCNYLFGMLQHWNKNNVFFAALHCSHNIQICSVKIRPKTQ